MKRVNVLVCFSKNREQDSVVRNVLDLVVAMLRRLVMLLELLLMEVTPQFSSSHLEGLSQQLLSESGLWITCKRISTRRN